MVLTSTHRQGEGYPNQGTRNRTKYKRGREVTESKVFRSRGEKKQEKKKWVR